MAKKLTMVLATVLITAACGGSASTGSPAAPPAASAAASPGMPVRPPVVASPVALPTFTAGVTPGAADAAGLYGFGPQPDPSVTYQPDVVLIGGGPDAIRGVSRDGLTWSVDARAQGVEQLVPGKVMFATSYAVGRVISVRPAGDTVDITLAPVDIGEVISDAHLVFDQAVPLEALSIYDAPQIEGGYEDVQSDELTATPAPGADTGGSYGAAPELIATAASARVPPSGPQSSGPNGSEASKKVGDWTLTAYRTAAALGLRAERGVGSSTVQGAELKVALDAHIEVGDLRVIADIPVVRGEVGSSHFRVFGIRGLSISVQAGAVNGLSDNRKLRVEVPVQLKQNVIIGGFPATLTQKFKFLVQTAFTAKNGNLTASASWDVDGSIGMDGQTVTLPSMTAREPKLIDTLAGVSVGVNGIVVAISFEFGLLFGLPIAGAGPVAAFITSLGMTNGSSLGIVQCKQVSITSTVSAGVGLQVFDPVKEAIKRVLGYEVPEKNDLISKNILEEAWVKPDVVACRG